MTRTSTFLIAACLWAPTAHVMAMWPPDLPTSLRSIVAQTSRSHQPSEPPRPARADVLTYRGHLGNLRDSAGRVIWTPALPGASEAVRAEWLKAIASAGGTHVPIGGFGPGLAYPGVAWSNPDWRQDPAAIRGLVLEILRTPGPNGKGMVPVIFTDGGPKNPKPRLQALFPVLSQALDGLDDSVLVIPAGWEPVVGDFTSAEVSWALETWHALRPRSLIGFHGSPGRLVGSSDPAEPDDPWRGSEPEFYKSHGGQFVDIALYQLPHGAEIYRDCDERRDDCYLNRWEYYVARVGTGVDGWRVLPIVAFETTAYEFFRGQSTEPQAREVATRLKRVCDKWKVSCGWGNGLPMPVR